jgi:hypothetical protein
MHSVVLLAWERTNPMFTRTRILSIYWVEWKIKDRTWVEVETSSTGEMA